MPRTANLCTAPVEITDVLPSCQILSSKSCKDCTITKCCLEFTHQRLLLLLDHGLIKISFY